MHVDLEALDPRSRYKLLTAAVIPRPVAWVTTQDVDGIVNAAPYSFFNLFGKDPATVILGLEHHADGRPKDTTANILATGEFVVHLATPSLLEAMVATAASYPRGTSEPAALGLRLAPSVKVAVPRLADAPVAIECRRTLGLTLGPEREILVGEAVGLATVDGRVEIDLERMYLHWIDELPVARLFGDRYASLAELPPRAIPEPVPVAPPARPPSGEPPP